MIRSLVLAWSLFIVVGQIAVAAPNDGSGSRGSDQRKQYCANQLIDCQYATDDTCKAHPERGSYCEADGYAVCNTLEDQCLAKAASSSGISRVPTSGLKVSPGH